MRNLVRCVMIEKYVSDMFPEQLQNLSGRIYPLTIHGVQMVLTVVKVHRRGILDADQRAGDEASPR